MKASEIKKKTEKDLQEELSRLREKLREFRFELAAGKVKVIKDIRFLKKDIARILTELNQRKLNNKDS